MVWIVAIIAAIFFLARGSSSSAASQSQTPVQPKMLAHPKSHLVRSRRGGVAQGPSLSDFGNQQAPVFLPRIGGVFQFSGVPYPSSGAGGGGGGTGSSDTGGGGGGGGGGGNIFGSFGGPRKA